MPYKSPAQHKAMKFLHKCIREHAQKGQFRLPTVVTLAQQADVSPVTIRKCIRNLKREGILSVSHGKGVNIVKAIPLSTTPPDNLAIPILPKWEMVYKQFHQDIINGIYAANSVLPPTKSLMERYGVCYRTLKKVIATLLKNRIIEHNQSGYRIPHASHNHFYATIILIVSQDAVGNMQRFTPRTEEYLRYLESVCSQSRIQLEIITCSPFNGTMKSHNKQMTTLHLSAYRNPVIGFFIWSMTLPHTIFDWIITTLAQYKKPIGILDETGTFDRTLSNTCKCPIKWFSVAYTSTSGRDTGNFLFTHGHRKIAYISPFHNNTWSPNRLKGLRTVFGTKPSNQTVTPFTTDNYTCAWDFVNRARNIHNQIAQILDSGYLPQYTSNTTFQRVIQKFHAAIDAILEIEAPHDILQKLFDSARTHKDITAWVCANDYVAQKAQEYLHRNKIRIPLDISIAGFDDSSVAFENRITSYNFNSTAIVNAMLSYILQTDSKPPRNKGLDSSQEVEIEGFVNKRESTTIQMR